MGLIKTGVRNILCGLGWHKFWSIPETVTFICANKPGKPHAVLYTHRCRYCDSTETHYHSFLRGQMEPENEIAGTQETII